MSLPALVLAAGRGTRLDPVTRLVAKPAVPLGDRTLIERVLAWLTGHGVRDVVLNLHHLPDTITAVVADGKHLGLTVRYSWETTLLGSAGGPRHALPLLSSDTFVVVNGDTLCDVNLAALLEAHNASGADATLAVVPNPNPPNYRGIRLDRNGVISEFIPRGSGGENWHFVGVQVVEARLFGDLADGVPADTVDDVYREAVTSSPGRIRAWIAGGDFIDVGSPRDYLAAASRWPDDESTRRAASRARIVRSLVWREATVGRGADLEDCLVVGRIDVPPGFRARSAVLAPPALFGPDERVEITQGMALVPIAGSGTSRAVDGNESGPPASGSVTVD